MRLLILTTLLACRSAPKDGPVTEGSLNDTAAPSQTESPNDIEDCTGRRFRCPMTLTQTETVPMSLQMP